MPRGTRHWSRYPVTPDACTHVGGGGSAWPVFSTIENRRRECARGRAQSARVPGGDGATGRATSVPWVSGHTDACTHVGAGRVGAAGFFDHREAAAGVCPWPRTVCASVGGRWRVGAGDFRTLAIRSHPMLAHMLARGGSARPVFRPPRSGGGSVPVAAHSLRECRGGDGATGRATSVPWVSGHTRCLHT